MASFMKEFEHLEIQLEEIISATNNFDDSRFIGSGGFGNVYRGELSHPEGKIMAAFKRLDRKLGQGDREFCKEIRMLSTYKHDNLISLLGFCKEGDEMILVYEYASRGSLKDLLNSIDLTWSQRLKICLDAAKGLSFLHDPNETQQRVLHRDIKSANILLDENLNAKVADFGLSKLVPANKQHTFLFTSPVGTRGYFDPLYFDTLVLIKESDVYSFGVVLFEVLCGRQCYGHQREVLVPYWKKTYEEKKLDDIIFFYLKHQQDFSSVETFADIAYQCLQETREERPAMSLVVEQLKAAKELYEAEQMRKAAECEYGEILKLADPPLIYKSVEELKALLSKGFLVNGGKTWFSLTEKGEHCEMLSIADCLISHRGAFLDTENCSRFGLVLETNKKGFKVHIRTQLLTPSIRYTVNLVFYKEWWSSAQKQKYVGLRYKFKGEKETSIVYVANETKDSCSFIAELYHFTSNGSTFDLKIMFEDHVDDLQVEGILLQPLEKAEHDQVLENEKLSNDSLQWTMKKDISSYPKKSFMGQEGYAVDDNGKKSLLLSARGLIKCCVGLSFQSSSESRFGEVAVINYVTFKIVKCIKSVVLSPKTRYAIYLIYKLPQDQSKFKGLLKITNKRGPDPDYPYVYLSRPETPIIGQKLDQNTHNPLIKTRQRGDGWMEVKVWQFQTPSSTKTVHFDIGLETLEGVSTSGLIIESIELRPIVGHSI